MTRKHLFPAAELLLGPAISMLALIPAEAQILRGGVGITDLGPGSGTVSSVALAVPSASIFGVLGSPVIDSGTLGLTTTGISGGIPFFSSTSQLSSSALLGANQLVLGSGAGAAPATPVGLGTTTMLLHGNDLGPPSWGKVDLSTDVTGSLPVGLATPGGVSGQIEWNNDGAFDGAYLGTGLNLDTTAKVLNLTSVSNDQTGAAGGNYTILADDSAKTVLVTGGGTTTLPQAGTTGFTLGWSTCVLNAGSSNSTLSTTTSLFEGAGGATSLTLRPGDWACPASDGTNYPTLAGSSSTGTATPGGVSGQMQWNNASAFDGFDAGTGLTLDTTAKQLKLTSVSNDQTGAAGGNYTVVTGDASKTVLVAGGGTTTLAQAGATGFDTGWSGCILNAGSSNTTLSTTISAFEGAGGGSTLTIRKNDWACPASDGANYTTVYGFSGLGLTVNGVLYGGGNSAAPSATAAGTPTTVLHGSSPPSFSKVDLSTDVTGSLPVGLATPGGVSGQIEWNNDGAFDGAYLGTGLNLDTTAKVLNLTNISNDQTGASGGNYTILAGDAAKTVLVTGGGTTTLPQAGTTGFTLGWSPCILNAGIGDTTLSTTTSLLKGAGGATSLALRPGDWVCPASDGADYPTLAGINYLGLTAGLPMIGGGAGLPLAQGTRSGNTTEFATSTGSKTSGHVVAWDADGNAVDGGVVAGSIGSGSVTQVNTGTGLTGGPITTTGTVALADTAVTPGSYTYTSLTVDQQGRLTAASSGTAPAAAANPTATAGATAVNGSASTYMRSDAAPAVQQGSSSQQGIVQVDGTTITASSGVIAGAKARDTMEMQAQWVTGAIVANGTIYLAYKAPYGGTVNSLDYFTGNGSYTVAIKINGTNVTCLSAVTVNSATPANTASCGASTFSAGDKITEVISGASGSPTDALTNLNVTWN